MLKRLLRTNRLLSLCRTILSYNLLLSVSATTHNKVNWLNFILRWLAWYLISFGLLLLPFIYKILLVLINPLERFVILGMLSEVDLYVLLTRFENILIFEELIEKLLESQLSCIQEFFRLGSKGFLGRETGQSINCKIELLFQLRLEGSHTWVTILDVECKVSRCQDLDNIFNMTSRCGLMLDEVNLISIGRTSTITLYHDFASILIIKVRYFNTLFHRAL